jgi:hypothetical protein
VGAEFLSRIVSADISFQVDDIFTRRAPLQFAPNFKAGAQNRGLGRQKKAV